MEMTMFEWNLRRIVMPAIALCVAVAAHAQPVADKPKYAVGDRWEYKGRMMPDDTPNDATRTVVEIARSDLLKIRQETGKVVEYDGAMNFMPGGEKDYARVLVRYPLKVGDEWQMTRKFPNPGTVETVKGKVVAYEPVTVPAGTFQCYRIEATTALTNGDYKENRGWTRWYCPEIKWYAKERIDTTIVSPGKPQSSGTKVLAAELVKFTPAK
jgi:hypothetical protein